MVTFVFFFVSFCVLSLSVLALFSRFLALYVVPWHVLGCVVFLHISTNVRWQPVALVDLFGFMAPPPATQWVQGSQRVFVFGVRLSQASLHPVQEFL